MSKRPTRRDDGPGMAMDGFMGVNHPMTNPEFVTQQLYSELRLADQRFLDERDRRYTEVKNAEEKALRIKEQADRDALGLAREIQTYKDERANQLREQIASERNLYASKNDLNAAVEKIQATVAPLLVDQSQQHGRLAGALDQRTLVFALIGAAIIIANFILNHPITVAP